MNISNNESRDWDEASVDSDGDTTLENDTARPAADSGSEQQPTSSGSACFHVVGIGASAGGLESLERFFAAMPVDTGMAFVVIQHLSPDFKSLMDELFARHTDLPIQRAEDGMLVEPNAVYLIPAKKEMIISDGRLLLTDKDMSQPLTMPIDRFFRSLAQDVGECAIGVILSGSGSDGSRGIRDIHDTGGMVVAETEATAKFDGMPLAAQETGIVDLIAAPERIPAALVKHIQRPALASNGAPNEATPKLEGIQAAFKLLNDAYGIDFSHYKPNTVGRRIQRRLAFGHSSSLDEYVERLRSDEAELNSLYHDLLIGVTQFFRDREAFAKFEHEIIPELVKNRRDNELRVWVAGCATGEEAYSLAMLLHERMEESESPLDIKIFATDVHRLSLDAASAGIYDEESLTDVTPRRLDRYFEKKRDGYHIVPELRQMVVFATHNVIKDAPFTKLDLITCRNMLIYFRPPAQRKALSLFHFGLRTGGVLFLGPSETPADLSDEFDTLDPHWKIYRKQRDVQLPSDMPLPLGSLPRVHRHGAASVAMAKAPPQASLMSAYDAMLARYMPAGLLINERRVLLHAFGGAEKYLQLKGGRPTDDVLELFSSDLRTAITGAVQRVLKEDREVQYSGVRVKVNGAEQRLDVAVEPLDNPRSKLRQLFIRIAPSVERTPKRRIKTEAQEGAENRQISRDRIESLEDELRFSKENLQATIEELETSNEEMQATNEELVASNEELQSTNEELQSVNEELYTVNAEYQKKIVEMSELTADMNNLLESTEIGTVFLDSELCIRKFTPQIGQEFHLLPQDIGRPIDSFAHGILYQDLLIDLRRVVETQRRCEKEVQTRDGGWRLLRILPYRIKGKTSGVVLTLIDVSSLKRAEAALSEAVRRRDEFLAMLSHELRNPLGAIMNATHIVARLEADDDRLREASEVIQRQSRQMSRLLDDLLDVSRITQNKIELRRTATELGPIISAAIESVRPFFNASEQSFNIDVGEEELWIDGDADRLQQALSNLLTNASKYTPSGGTIELACYADEQDLVINVRDDGVGIAPEKLDKVFDLFVQSEETLHRSKGGMGVGLTLVRSIAELHGGSVSVHSDGIGSGSDFTMRLPRLNPPKQRPRQENMSEDVRSASRGSGRIVVVEDQEDNRNLLKSLLELEGYEVFTAENGPQGLAVIENRSPDIALVDIGLPGLNGYEVARQVRTTLGNTHTYLVALTGYGQSSDVQEAFESGFDNHLVKPLDPQKLSRILEFHTAKAEGSASTPQA